MLLPWLVLAGACRFPAPVEQPLPPFGSWGAGVVRLGPPAPSAGPYDVAVDPDTQTVFVSNLRVPFVTMADATTGAWQDALDLLPSGEQRFPDPRLYLIDGVLHVPSEGANTMLRYDAASLEPLPGIFTGAPMTTHRAWGDELWIATPEEVTRYDGFSPVASFSIDFYAAILSVDETRLAFVDVDQGLVLLYDRDGQELWTAPLDAEQIGDVLVMGDRVYVADRLGGQVLLVEDGAVTASAPVGADTCSLSRHGDTVLAVARLGEALPESGTYQGAPSRVVALDADLTQRWSADTDRGVRFLTPTPETIWAVAGDSRRLIGLDPDDGQPTLHGPPLGLSLDGMARLGNRVLFPSQTDDTLHWVDFGDGTSGAVEVCGFPDALREHRGGLWLACLDEGRIQLRDPDSLALLDEWNPTATFHRPCADATCEQALVGMDMADDRGVLAYSDPSLPGVRWVDEREPAPFAVDDLEPDLTQHIGLRVLGDALLAHDPFGRHTWLVEREATDLGSSLGGSGHDLPLVGGGERVWLGAVAIDRSLAPSADLGRPLTVVAAGTRWLVVEHGWVLETYDAASQERTGSLDMIALRAPPMVHSADAEPSPLRYLVVEPDLLVIGNAYRATLELRRLPGLEPIGGDEVVALGAWSALPGLD